MPWDFQIRIRVNKSMSKDLSAETERLTLHAFLSLTFFSLFFGINTECVLLTHGVPY